MSERRVYFFNRFFWPDNSATAQILTDLCRSLESRGFSITVVTSRLNYGNPSLQYPAEDSLGGIRIRRLWSTRFGRNNSLGRLLDYLTIYLSFFLFALRRIGPGDVAVFKTDPPLLSVPGAVASKWKGFSMVSWCQDLFPEVAVSEIRIPRGAGWIFRFIAAMRDWSLNNSDKVVVLGEDMQAYLEGRGIPLGRLLPISNWAVQDEGKVEASRDMRVIWGIPRDTFVFGYSGNLGRAHDWKTVLDAARECRNQEGLLFLCCGGGYGYERLREAVKEAGLEPRFLFLPYQPLEDLAASLKVPDVHWFTLKARLTPFIFPSKFFGILQAAKPLVFIGERSSEMGRLIEETDIGAVVEEGNSLTLAKVIRDCMNNRSQLAEAGQRARQLWEKQYQKDTEVRKWELLLTDLPDKIKGDGNA